MGTVSSKDTRRISFDNTFALSPALVDQKSIEDDNVLDINAIAAVTDKSDELQFPDKHVPFEAENDDLEIDYWAQRIDKLKQEHRIINKIIETEYEKTLENTNKLLQKSQIGSEEYEKVKPCFEWRTKILQCYEENPRQPLVCSPIVQAFNECVSSCRIQE